MEYILSAARMAEADRKTIEEMHVPQAVLMERAALEAYHVLDREGILPGELPKAGILLFIGPGNNGGDGLALARILAEQGAEPVVVMPGGEEKTSEAEKQQLAALKALCPELRIRTEAPEQVFGLVIDAIFGVSLNRPVEGVFAQAVKEINTLHERGAKTVSLDIPSGVHATTARVLGQAVMADLTVAFAYRKFGHVLFPGANFCGKTVCVPIGITDRAIDTKTAAFAYRPEEISLPERVSYSNKGTYGKVLMAAGSSGMAGAAALSAEAAFRSGCGMVRLYTHEDNRTILQTALPEALVSTYGNGDPLKELESCFEWCDVTAVGPGISRSEAAGAILRRILTDSPGPVVADADALNIISGDPQMLLSAAQDVVITPHVGEMARLTGLPARDITEHLIETAMDFAKSYNVVCVLKDARTVIAEPGGRVCINLNGNNGMATAGSGDVLTGIIAAFLAQGLKPFQAAHLACAVHGRAGDAAAARLGKASVMARDIVGEIR